MDWWRWRKEAAGKRDEGRGEGGRRGTGEKRDSGVRGGQMRGNGRDGEME